MPFDWEVMAQSWDQIAQDYTREAASCRSIGWDKFAEHLEQRAVNARDQAAASRETGRYHAERKLAMESI